MPARSESVKSRPEAADLVSEDAIRQRAYYMWEADGRPEGRGDHYWGLAHAEATRAFVEATGDAVARATRGRNGAAAPAAVAPTKATRVKVKEAAPQPRLKAKAAGEDPRPKKATKPRAAVPKPK